MDLLVISLKHKSVLAQDLLILRNVEINHGDSYSAELIWHLSLTVQHIRIHHLLKSPEYQVIETRYFIVYF